MVQLIIRQGKVICATTVPYDERTIRSMKREGLKVKEVDTYEPPAWSKNPWFKGETTDE